MIDSIERKSLLYKTGVEYGDYTINIAEGCSHGCKYPCYAMMMAKRFGKVKTYEDWCQPKIVSNALELLDKEIPKLKHKIRSVQLCFTTDSFMYNNPEISELSFKCIQKLNDNGIKCTALTKGILPFELSQLSRDNEYGIILENISFADIIIFGRLNYNAKVSQYKNYKQFFNEMANKVITFCVDRGKQYHIKDGTITNI